MYAMQPTIIIAAGHSTTLHETALEMVAIHSSLFSNGMRL